MSEVLLEVNGLKKHFSAGSRFFLGHRQSVKR